MSIRRHPEAPVPHHVRFASRCTTAVAPIRKATCARGGRSVTTRPLSGSLEGGLRSRLAGAIDYKKRLARKICDAMPAKSESRLVPIPPYQTIVTDVVVKFGSRNKLDVSIETR